MLTTGAIYRLGQTPQYVLVLAVWDEPAFGHDVRVAPVSTGERARVLAYDGDVVVSERITEGPFVVHAWMAESTKSEYLTDLVCTVGSNIVDIVRDVSLAGILPELKDTRREWRGKNSADKLTPAQQQHIEELLRGWHDRMQAARTSQSPRL